MFEVIEKANPRRKAIIALSLASLGLAASCSGKHQPPQSKKGPECTGAVFSQPPGYTDGSLLYVFPLIDGHEGPVSDVHGKVVSGTNAGSPVLPTKYEDHGVLGYTWDASHMGVQHSRVKVEGKVAGQPFSCPEQDMTFNPATGQVEPSSAESARN